MSDLPVPIEVDVEQVRQWLGQRDDLYLLDCREPREYEIAKIDGAVLFPMSQLGQRIDELEPLRSKHIVVHCHHGGRSLRVAQWLRQQGFSSAQSMAGGIDAWSESIDPNVPRY